MQISTLQYGYSPNGISYAIPAESMLERLKTLLFAAFGLGSDTERGMLEAKFRGIVTSHGDMLRKVCYGYARNSDELDDLYQDTLVNVWQGLPKFRGDASLRTWLYRIALNTCVSTLRSRKKEIPCVDTDMILEVPDNDSETIEAVKDLHAAISLMNPLDKAIILLWLDDFSYDEIANTVGITKSSVAVRIHRAKDKLKDLSFANET